MVDGLMLRTLCGLDIRKEDVPGDWFAIELDVYVPLLSFGWPCALKHSAVAPPDERRHESLSHFIKLISC